MNHVVPEICPSQTAPSDPLLRGHPASVTQSALQQGSEETVLLLSGALPSDSRTVRLFDIAHLRSIEAATR